MTDILAFIAVALLSILWFGLVAVFGIAYARASDAKFTTPDGLITFDLNKLLEFEERRIDKQLEEQANND